MKSTVLVTEPIGAPGLALLEERCRVIAAWRDDPDVEFENARADLWDADAVVVRLFPVRRGDLERARRLKVVAKHGVGVDNIDCEAATEKGIPVLYTPGGNANAVAEHTFALLFALLRRTEASDRSVRAAGPWRREDFQGVELAGKTLGVIGLGRIGTLVATKATLGFGMKVIAYDPYVDRNASRPFAVEFCDTLQELVTTADATTLHVPLTNETRGLIDGRVLGQIKSSGRLINTSRGAVVDESALATALSSGQLAGAALDVFEEEPLPPGHPLRAAPNTVLTPHIAGLTDEAMIRISTDIARGVLEILEGGRPSGDLANPEVKSSFS